MALDLDIRCFFDEYSQVLKESRENKISLVIKSFF